MGKIATSCSSVFLLLASVSGLPAASIEVSSGIDFQHPPHRLIITLETEPNGERFALDSWEHPGAVQGIFHFGASFTLPPAPLPAGSVVTSAFFWGSSGRPPSTQRYPIVEVTRVDPVASFRAASVNGPTEIRQTFFDLTGTGSGCSTEQTWEGGGLCWVDLLDLGFQADDFRAGGIQVKASTEATLYFIGDYDAWDAYNSRTVLTWNFGDTYSYRGELYLEYTEPALQEGLASLSTPEPATCLLTACFLVAIGFIARSRRSKGKSH